jgi:hypothetical protein
MAGLRAALNILDKWQASCEQRGLPGLAHFAQHLHPGQESRFQWARLGLDADQLQRISLVLNIHAALRLVFDNPENVYGFPAMANRNAFFNGRAPLEIMAQAAHDLRCTRPSAASMRCAVPVVTLSSLASLDGEELQAHREVNSKFPPIALFDDVADAADFDALYQLQALTNPRLLNEIGRLGLIARERFRSVSPAAPTRRRPLPPERGWLRFSDGSFGVLYLADGMDTAIAEVRCHQERYWSNVPDLNYERFVFRADLPLQRWRDARRDGAAAERPDLRTPTITRRRSAWAAN